MDVGDAQYERLSGKFRYEQTAKYEVARDLLNAKRAALAASLGLERRKAELDVRTIEGIQLEMRRVAYRVRSLDIADESGLDAVISLYRRQEIDASGERLLAVDDVCSPRSLALASLLSARRRHSL